MAYSFPWVVTTPLGSAARSLVDNNIRDDKEGLKERLEDVLIKDTTADPWEVKDEVSGAITGNEMYISFTAFQNDETDAGINWTATKISSLPTDGPLRAPLTMPVGAAITKIEMLMSNDDTNTVTWGLWFMAFDTGLSAAAVAGGTKLESGTGTLISELVVAHTIAAGTYYLMLDKSAGNAYAIHGVRVTYDLPDNSVRL